MKLSTLTKVTRWTICLAALVFAFFAWQHNKAHLFTAGVIFVVGLNVEWVKREDNK